LASALHAVRKLNYIAVEKKPKRALIIGAGTIGLLLLIVLKHMKIVDEVYISDKIPFKLEVARELGADRVLTPAELSNYNSYFDIVFEAVGGFAIEKTINLAISALRGKGVIVLLGAVEISPRVRLGIFHVKEGFLIGSFISTYQDYIEAYNLVNHRSIKLSRLITHRLPLSDAPKAIRIALSGESIKAMLIGE